MIARIVRCVALAACFATLGGCAEINRRGGLVAQVEDAVLFPAQTKSHRLFRSYVMVGALITVARHTQMSEVDRTALSGTLVAALDVVDDAYKCLYPDRTEATAKRASEVIPAVQDAVCVFFDERMTRLDYAIYKLAVNAMFDADSRAYVAAVRNKMLGDIPVLGRAAAAATKIVDAANETAGAIHNATEFVNGLLNFSYRVGGTAVYLFPIYRDVLEFDMRLALTMLQERSTGMKLGRDDFVNDYPPPGDFNVLEPASAYAMLKYGVSLFRNGNGNLELWRGYLNQLGAASYLIEASPLHFAIMSRWIDRSCRMLFPNPADAKGPDDSVEKKCRPLPEVRELPSAKLTYVRPHDGATVPIEARRGKLPALAKPTPKNNPNFAAPPTTPLRDTTGSRPREQ